MIQILRCRGTDAEGTKPEVLRGLFLGRRTRVAVLVVLTASVAGAAQSARALDRNTERFRAVKKWTGTFRMTWSHAGRDPDQLDRNGEGITNIRGSTNWRASGFFLLDSFGWDATVGRLYWGGTGTSQLQMDLEESDMRVGRVAAYTGPWRHKMTISRPAEPPTYHGVLAIENGQYRLYFAAEGLGEDEREDKWNGRHQREDNASAAIEASGVLPTGGLRLSGSAEVSVNQPGFHSAAFARPIAGDTVAPHGWAFLLGPRIQSWSYDGRHPPGLPPPPKAKVEWDVAPVIENLKLDVIIDGYDDWLPQGHRDPTKPGNHLSVRAELKTMADGEPQRKAERIKFQLTEVSQEPGVAMNWPSNALSAGNFPDIKDLRFDQDRNGGLQVGGGYAVEAATPAGEHDKADAVISCYDYGAWGTLRVTAEFPDGVVVGRLVHNLKQEILLPKRKDDSSKIADAWKDRWGVSHLADTGDGENDPEGDGIKGDGLSLYEEYRGFFENGHHVHGQPAKKDVFVRDEVNNIRTRWGIGLFKSVTGLEVHGQLRPAEINSRLLINFNKKTAHIVDQHGILLVSGGTTAEWAGGEYHSWVRTIHMARVPLSVDPYDAKTVAHELLHAVRVEHHGDDDLYVKWTAGNDANNVRRVYETLLDDQGNAVSTPRVIEVYSTDGNTPQYFRGFGPPGEVWVAVRGGQHSGQEDCLLRYASANALAPSATSPIRYFPWSGGTSGRALCSSARGTGINDPGRSPSAGSATRQGCKQQVRVRDN